MVGHASCLDQEQERGQLLKTARSLFTETDKDSWRNVVLEDATTGPTRGQPGLGADKGQAALAAAQLSLGKAFPWEQRLLPPHP